MDNVSLSTKIDWLTVTSKGDCESMIVPMVKGEQKSGMLGYESRCVYEYFTHYEGTQGTMIMITGQELDNIRRDFGLDDIGIMKSFKSEKCTRIDLTLDVYNSSLTAIGMEGMLYNGDLNPLTKKAHLEKDSLQEEGDTWYLGSRKTRQKLLRCYEKSKKEKDFLNRFRLELQLGKEGGSIQAYNKALEIGQENLSDFIIGSIKGILRPKEGTEMDKILNADVVKNVVGAKPPSNTQKWLLSDVLPVLAREAHKDADFWSLWVDALSKALTQESSKNPPF